MDDQSADPNRQWRFTDDCQLGASFRRGYWKREFQVTFRNGTTCEYPLADMTVMFNEDEHGIRAAVVPDLVGEVLLGRDVPLYNHIVYRLPNMDQIARRSRHRKAKKRG